MALITNLPWFALIILGMILAHYTPLSRVLP